MGHVRAGKTVSSYAIFADTADTGKMRKTSCTNAVVYGKDECAE